MILCLYITHVTDPTITGIVQNHLSISDPQIDSLMLNETLSYKEVENAINAQKLKKVCSADNIPNEILKNPNI